MAELLQSWKEIAAYLRRSVRTAQRWERNFGLPVHRPAGDDRSAVMAIPEEIDRWAAGTRSYAESIESLKARVEELEAELLRLKLSLPPDKKPQRNEPDGQSRISA